MVGHALGVVAGGHGDHATLAFIGGKRRKPVQGAPLFERRGELQVLELEPHIAAQDVGERAAPVAARLEHGAAQARASRLDIARLTGNWSSEGTPGSLPEG